VANWAEVRGAAHAVEEQLGTVAVWVNNHLLGRPRDHPIRSAFGAAVLTFYVVLFVAGSQDVIAQKLGVSIAPVTVALRVLLLVLPVVVAVVTYAVCRDLAQDKRSTRPGRRASLPRRRPRRHLSWWWRVNGPVRVSPSSRTRTLDTIP
jgi:hypothetical protein